MSDYQWCLCWSQSQNCLHIESLGRHLSTNRDAYRDDRGGDYRLLFVGTRQAVDDAAAAMRSTIAQRDAGRSIRWVA